MAAAGPPTATGAVDPCFGAALLAAATLSTWPAWRLSTGDGAATGEAADPASASRGAAEPTPDRAVTRGTAGARPTNRPAA